jgi:hypothetical protein
MSELTLECELSGELSSCFLPELCSRERELAMESGPRSELVNSLILLDALSGLARSENYFGLYWICRTGPAERGNSSVRK